MLKKLTIMTAAATASAFFAGTAIAGEVCTQAPASEWRSQDDAKAAATALGYEVVRVKVEDGCYELYARKGGNKLEVFMDPVKLTVVREKGED